jgi:hypothetical protein
MNPQFDYEEFEVMELIGSLCKQLRLLEIRFEELEIKVHELQHYITQEVIKEALKNTAEWVDPVTGERNKNAKKSN